MTCRSSRRRRQRTPSIRRDRLWEIERDASVFEEILAGGGAWTEIYRADEAKAAWRELRSGGDGSAKWEAVFEGIVYRHSFDAHLRRLAAASAGLALAFRPCRTTPFISRHLRSRRLRGRAEAGPPAPFVVGVGRSGTTLLRLMLDAPS